MAAASNNVAAKQVSQAKSSSTSTGASVATSQAQQDLTSARTNYIKAQIDRAVAAAQLDRVTATLLERHDIRIER